ncbi:MAG: hypothetical protein J5449_11985, partial [Oscillospiraceae bacterium]|nr:hypothetical protein [Oscillospiraceae bacterium]
ELRQMLLDNNYAPIAPAYRTLVAAGSASLGTKEYESLYVISDATLTGKLTVLHKIGGTRGKTLTLNSGSTLTVGRDAFATENGLSLAGKGTLRLEQFRGGNITFNGVSVGNAFVEYWGEFAVRVCGVAPDAVTLSKLEAGHWENDSVVFQTLSLNDVKVENDNGDMLIRLKDGVAMPDWDCNQVRLTLKTKGTVGTVVYDTLWWRGNDEVTPEQMAGDLQELVSTTAFNKLTPRVGQEKYGKADEPITYGSALAMFTDVYHDAWGKNRPLTDDQLRSKLSLSEFGYEDDWTLSLWSKDRMIDTLTDLLPPVSIAGGNLTLRRLESGEEQVRIGSGNWGGNWFINKTFDSPVTVVVDPDTVSEEEGWSGQVQFRNCEFAEGLTIVAAEGKDFAVNFNNSCAFGEGFVTVSGESVNSDNRHHVLIKQMPEQGLRLSTDTPLIIERAHDGESGIPDNAEFTVNGVSIVNHGNGGGFEVIVDRMEDGEPRVGVNAEEQRRDSGDRLLTGDAANGFVSVSGDEEAYAAVNGYVDVSGMEMGRVELGEWRWRSTVVLGGASIYIPRHVRDRQLTAVGSGSVYERDTAIELIRVEDAYAERKLTDVVPCAELYDGDDLDGGHICGVRLFLVRDYAAGEAYTILNNLIESFEPVLSDSDGETIAELAENDVLWLDGGGNIIYNDRNNWMNDVKEAVIVIGEYNDELDDVRLDIFDGNEDLCSVGYLNLHYGWRNTVDLVSLGDALTRRLAENGFDQVKLGGYNVSQYRAWNESTDDWGGSDGMYNSLLGTLKSVWPEHNWEGGDAWGGKRFNRVMLGLVVRLLGADYVRKNYADPGMSVHYNNMLTILGKVWTAADRSGSLPEAVSLEGRENDDTGYFDHRDKEYLIGALIDEIRSVHSVAELVAALSRHDPEVLVRTELELTDTTLEGVTGEALTEDDGSFTLTVPVGTVLIIGENGCLGLDEEISLKLADGFFEDANGNKITEPSAGNLVWETGRNGERYVRTACAGLVLDGGRLWIGGAFEAGKLSFIDNLGKIYVAQDCTMTLDGEKDFRIEVDLDGGTRTVFNGANLNNNWRAAEDGETIQGELSVSGTVSAANGAQIHNMGTVTISEESGLLTLNAAGFNNNFDDRGTESYEDDVCGELIVYGEAVLDGGSWLHNNGNVGAEQGSIKVKNGSSFMNFNTLDVYILNVDQGRMVNYGECEVGTLRVTGANSYADNAGAWLQMEEIELTDGGRFMHDVLENSEFAFDENEKTAYWTADDESRVLVCLIEDDKTGQAHQGPQGYTAENIKTLFGDRYKPTDDEDAPIDMQIYALTANGLDALYTAAGSCGMKAYQIIIGGNMTTNAEIICDELGIDGVTLTLGNGARIQADIISGWGEIVLGEGSTLFYDDNVDNVKITPNGGYENPEIE